MAPIKIKSPGVYIQEVNAFPNTITPVPTAVPAFVGYTPNVIFEGKSYLNMPTKITSFAAFQTLFCGSETTPEKPYKPEYYSVKQATKPNQGDYITISGDYYTILPDPNTIYYLYNSVRLFYENGGGDAYIVSVGTYGEPSKKPTQPGELIVNSNVKLNELLAGIEALKNEEEPTLYICPEATLLALDNNGTLMQTMLMQNAEMGTAISIFDIIGARNPDPLLYTDDLLNFRNHTGNQGLKYGCAYYPFLETTLMQDTDIDFTNLFGGNVKALEPLLNPSSSPNQSAADIIANIENRSNLETDVITLNNALLNASTTYKAIMKLVLADANKLPPSGGIAGVITRIDNQSGPWQAPANTSFVGVTSLTIKLNESQQSYFNVDPVSGKSINVIRVFSGLGALIWGARTLDGNSNDWRYIPVCRTLIFLEQSCKQATRAYVFEPNVKNTWDTVKVMIDNFLTSVWRGGGLQGAKPDDAFSVRCGLGTTMTAEDILNGLMIVSVAVAIVRPAEFIMFTFQQEMATSN